MPARLTKEELLKLANGTAAQLNMKPVAKRMLSDWVDEKLISGAKARGIKRGINPERTYEPESAERVRIILALKSLGASRFDVLRICLWAFGYEIALDSVKAALQLEYERWMKRERRKLQWRYDHRSPDHASESARAKYMRHLPPLDPYLAVTGLVFSPSALLYLMSEACWGSDDGKEASQSIIASEIERIFEMPAETALGIVKFISVSEIFGSPDEVENSGQEALKSMKDEDLLVARTLFWLAFLGLFAGDLFLTLFSNEAENKMVVAYRKAMNSVVRPEWIIPTVGIFAVLVSRSKYIANLARVA